VLLLVGAFLLQRTLTIWAGINDYPMTQSIVAFGWLGVCIYSWVAPGVYRRMLAKELDTLKLADDF
jgi:hypothetical protein